MITLTITHKVPLRLLPLWRRVFCRRGWHAFDEVATPDEHHLCCDACDLMVAVAGIDRTYCREGKA